MGYANPFAGRGGQSWNRMSKEHIEEMNRLGFEVKVSYGVHIRPIGENVDWYEVDYPEGTTPSDAVKEYRENKEFWRKHWEELAQARAKVESLKKAGKPIPRSLQDAAF